MWMAPRRCSACVTRESAAAGRSCGPGQPGCSITTSGWDWPTTASRPTWTWTRAVSTAGSTSAIRAQCCTSRLASEAAPRTPSSPRAAARDSPADELQGRGDLRQRAVGKGAAAAQGVVHDHDEAPPAQRLDLGMQCMRLQIADCEAGLLIEELHGARTAAELAHPASLVNCTSSGR